MVEHEQTYHFESFDSFKKPIDLECLQAPHSSHKARDARAVRKDSNFQMPTNLKDRCYADMQMVSDRNCEPFKNSDHQIYHFGQDEVDFKNQLFDEPESRY